MTIEVKVQEALDNIKSQVKSALDKANEAAANGDKYGNELKSQIKSLNDEVKDLHAAQAELSQKGQQLTFEEPKSFGQLIVDGLDLSQKSTGHILEGKAAASPVLGVSHDGLTGTGAILPSRVPGVVSDPLERLTVVDLLTRIPTGSNAIEYVQEVNTTLNAAETAEGSQKPESQFDFMLKQIHIATVAHFTRVSKQFRDDAPALMALINNRMLFGVRQKLNNQIIAGDGSMPNINGLIGVAANHTAFTPTASEQQFDGLRRMKGAIEDSEHMATAILMNPADITAMDLLKDGNDNYLASNPRTGANAMAWGLPVVPSKAVAVGKAMVGDFANAMTLWDREQVGVEVFEQDGDNVTKNLLTIRAEGRFQITAEHPKAIVYGDLKAA